MTKFTSDNSVELPSIPSQLLELALTDLERAEKSPDHTVNMGVWMRIEDRTCNVCLAGSVMAFSLDVALSAKGFEVSPNELDTRSKNLIESLDYFRTGSLYSASIRLARADTDPKMVKTVRAIGYRPTPDYDRADPDPFKASMRDLISVLKAAGA